MSTSLARAIGYGMDWHEFESLCLLDCEANETVDALEGLFSALTDEAMTVDQDSAEKIWNAVHVPSIMERRLLALRYTDGNRRPSKAGSAVDLYSVVMEPDDDMPTHVIFYPTVACAKQWHRRNDDIDLAFERWRDGVSRDYSPDARSFAKTVAYGHYPWTNYLMREDGTPEPWLMFRDLQERHDLVAAVPSEIRWYLVRHGVLADEGVNRLRPMIAQWWP